MANLTFQPQQVEPFLCTCGPCKQFWKDTFKSSSECLFRSNEGRSTDTATLTKEIISVGDRVTVDGKPGSVKFVGFVDDNVIAPTLRIGIKLDESVHVGHDGMLNGKRYFYCTNGHGILVRYKDVTPLRKLNRRPPVKGNAMFPSWPEICKRRKQRTAMLEEMEKSGKTSKPGGTAKTPRPPLISLRENRTQQLRREATSGPFLIVRDDPNDLAYQDKHHQRKKKMLVASLSTPEAMQANWELRLMQQWRRKYDDEEKASRMGETLQRLLSAYKEGMNYRPQQNAD